MLSLIFRKPKTLLNCGKRNRKSLSHIFCCLLSEEPFKKPLKLWGDRGGQTLYSNDNIGGWQSNDSWLLNRIDLNNVKYQSFKGFKEMNEDRFKVTELSPEVVFLGVFDGHGGSFVVDFVQRYLDMYVKRFLDNGRCSLTTALRRGFIDCDMALARELGKNGRFYRVKPRFLHKCLIHLIAKP